MGGLASGEGLIASVADADEQGQGGNTDKRLLVYEPEFARVLGVAAREGSTLSPIIRDAWDTGRLRVMTRKSPLVASGAHISIVGHVTVDELRRRMADSEAANGFANRFLFACVRRSKLLPSGGELGEGERTVLGRSVRDALREARKLDLLKRSPDAETYWTELYEMMADDDAGGLVGDVTARAEAQTLRLAVVYALLDGSRLIERVHLEAVYAVWRYCEGSARYIFGDSLGDDVSDRLLDALRRAGTAGMDGTEQRDLFGRHVSGKRLDLARQLLESRGLARTESEATGGRPRLVTRAVPRPATKAMKATELGEPETSVANGASVAERKRVTM